MQFPRSVAVDREGTVYVADWGNHRVQTFTSEGRYLGKLGELRYNDLGGFFTPEQAATTDTSEIIVLVSGRVHRFAASWRLMGQWGKPFQLKSHTGIAVAPDGYVFGMNGNYLRESVVLKFDPTGNQIEAWGQYGQSRGQLYNPSALPVDASGRVYVADWNGSNSRVVVFDPHGVVIDQLDLPPGDRLPGLRNPSGLAVDRQGHIYVTDSRLRRLHKFGPFPLR